jgi:membrane protease YdiL (CAAX protease family)
MQLLVLAFALWIGHIRGWSLASFGARVSWKGTGAGLLLFIVTLLAVIFCIVLTNTFAPGLRNPANLGVKVSGVLTLPFILLMALVNPIYEEVLEAGYFTHALQKFGMVPAVVTSALFVTFLHSFKGIDAFVMVLPWRLVFGFCYWRWRQLWPLVFAHVIIDIQGLLAAAAA